MSAPHEQGALGPESTPSELVTILYTNHRGETAVRRITPIAREWFGSSDWHPEPQWLFTAFDMDKEAFRDFARSGVKAWGQAAVDAALSASAPASGAERMTAGEARVGRRVARHVYWCGEPLFTAATPELAAEIVARLNATPTPATPPGVPDSVRAMSEAATPGRWEAGDGRANGSFNYVYSDDATGSAIATFQLSHVYLVEKTTRANAQFAAAAVNFVRTLLATHPAGQSAGSGVKCPECFGSGLRDIDGTSDDKCASCDGSGVPAPGSPLTGPVGVEGKLVKLLAAVSDRLRDNPPNGLVEGDLYVAAKNDGPNTGWRYVPTGLTVGDLDEARAALAARPASPEAQGAWRPISTAPKDGTEIWAWLYDSGVRKLRWWSAEEICEEEDHGTPEAYQAGFYEVADRTEWWNPAWWVPADRLPAPPSSSGQGGR